jgi:hypothetical protein
MGSGQVNVEQGVGGGWGAVRTPPTPAGKLDFSLARPANVPLRMEAATARDSPCGSLLLETNTAVAPMIVNLPALPRTTGFLRAWITEWD